MEASAWLAEPKPANRNSNARPRIACFGAGSFHSCGVGEGWSQSPVLPWTQRAYETCLSAGSTAMGC